LTASTNMIRLMCIQSGHGNDVCVPMFVVKAANFGVGEPPDDSHPLARCTEQLCVITLFCKLRLSHDKGHLSARLPLIIDDVQTESELWVRLNPALATLQAIELRLRIWDAVARLPPSYRLPMKLSPSTRRSLVRCNHSRESSRRLSCHQRSE
jgi:hypothetical protein